MEKFLDCSLVEEKGFKFVGSGLKWASICEAITFRYFCLCRGDSRMNGNETQLVGSRGKFLDFLASGRVAVLSEGYPGRAYTSTSF